jgi:hypothetical protein
MLLLNTVKVTGSVLITGDFWALGLALSAGSPSFLAQPDRNIATASVETAIVLHAIAFVCFME